MYKYNTIREIVFFVYLKYVSAFLFSSFIFNSCKDLHNNIKMNLRFYFQFLFLISLTIDLGIISKLLLL
jgi:hypothetical protein